MSDIDVQRIAITEHLSRSDLEQMSREQLYELIDRLRHEALHDSLTGVANRSLFMDRLEHARALARRTRGRFAVLVMDLDSFKEVNDRYGHAAGDALLSKTAQRLGVGLRESDTVARLGGDEFGLILYGADRAGAEHVSRLLRVDLSKIVKAQGVEVSTGVSIGAAIFPDDGADTFDLLRKADADMYRDKQGGEAAGPGFFKKMRGGRHRPAADD
jgi:diguanylate cyclase (GGDEF)-like protein